MKKFDNNYDIQVQDEDLNIEGSDINEVGKLRACKNLSELFSKFYDKTYKSYNKLKNIN